MEREKAIRAEGRRRRQRLAERKRKEQREEAALKRQALEEQRKRKRQFLSYLRREFRAEDAAGDQQQASSVDRTAAHVSTGARSSVNRRRGGDKRPTNPQVTPWRMRAISDTPKPPPNGAYSAMASDAVSEPPARSQTRQPAMGHAAGAAAAADRRAERSHKRRLSSPRAQQGKRPSPVQTTPEPSIFPAGSRRHDRLTRVAPVSSITGPNDATAPLKVVTIRPRDDTATATQLAALETRLYPRQQHPIHRIDEAGESDNSEPLTRDSMNNDDGAADGGGRGDGMWEKSMAIAPSQVFDSLDLSVTQTQAEVIRANAQAARVQQCDVYQDLLVPSPRDAHLAGNAPENHARRHSPVQVQAQVYVAPAVRSATKPPKPAEVVEDGDHVPPMIRTLAGPRQTWRSSGMAPEANRASDTVSYPPSTITTRADDPVLGVQARAKAAPAHGHFQTKTDTPEPQTAPQPMQQPHPQESDSNLVGPEETNVEQQQIRSRPRPPPPRPAVREEPPNSYAAQFSRRTAAPPPQQPMEEHAHNDSNAGKQARPALLESSQEAKLMASIGRLDHLLSSARQQRTTNPRQEGEQPGDADAEYGAKQHAEDEGPSRYTRRRALNKATQRRKLGSSSSHSSSRSSTGSSNKSNHHRGAPATATAHKSRSVRTAEARPVAEHRGRRPRSRSPRAAKQTKQTVPRHAPPEQAVAGSPRYSPLRARKPRQQLRSDVGGADDSSEALARYVVQTHDSDDSDVAAKGADAGPQRRGQSRQHDQERRIRQHGQRYSGTREKRDTNVDAVADRVREKPENSEQDAEDAVDEYSAREQQQRRAARAPYVVVEEEEEEEDMERGRDSGLVTTTTANPQPPQRVRTIDGVSETDLSKMKRAGNERGTVLVRSSLKHLLL